MKNTNILDKAALLEELQNEIAFLREENTTLRELLKYDSLTASRSQRDLILLQKTEVYENHICFAFDIKDLGKYNVFHGHNKGDIFLVQFSQRLHNIFGRDNVYRRGGDEFVVIVSYKIIEDIGHILTRLNDMYRISYIGYSTGTGSVKSLIDKAFEGIEKLKQNKC